MGVQSVARTNASPTREAWPPEFPQPQAAYCKPLRILIRLIRLPREKHVAAALAYRRAAEGAPDEEGKEQLGGQLPQTQPRETC